jgi:predicted outer membrane repeat protein
MGARGGTVSNCTFTENRGTALVAFLDSIVSDCTFSGNTEGHALTLSDTAKAIRCTFRNNQSTDSGGAIFAGVQGSQRIEDCVFVNNRSEGVGGAIVGIFSNLTVINCVFNGNSAAVAGGAIAGQGTLDFDGNRDLGWLRVVNSTFYGNSAPLRGAISLGDLFTSVQNSILWGNGPDSLEGDRAAVSYSVVEGGADDTGNIDADPLFVDAEGGDFRLRNDSPAIDAGSAESHRDWAHIPVPDVDIDGVARPQGDGIDMGAYENTGEIPTVETSLTTNVVGMGSVDPSEGDYSFAEGSTPPTITLTATPAEDWRFLEWQGALTGSDNPAQLEMGEDRDLTAVFEEIPIIEAALAVTVLGMGSVEPPCGIFSYREGDDPPSVTLTATPEENWRFTEWQGDTESTNNPLARIFHKR